MIHVQISHTRRQLVVTGHESDPRLCGAVTMLLRGAAGLASRMHYTHGQSAVELTEDWQADFEALAYGVETLLKDAKGYSVTYVDRLQKDIDLL